MSGAGDVNADGYSDVIVGAIGYGNGESFEGAAIVFLGSAEGITCRSPADADAVLESNQSLSYMGISVAGAGDVDGDGFDDVIVGAAMYDNGQPDEGAAFGFVGSATGIADGNPATAAVMFESDQAEAGFGLSVAGVGDVNGDGVGGVIIGAPHYSNGQANEGAAFIYLAEHGTGGPAGAQAILESDMEDANFGYSVAAAGDVNGDGFGDVIVGAPGYAEGIFDEGGAFVFLGNGGVAGRPTLVRQWRTVENIPVQSFCRSGSEDSFRVSMQAFPMGASRWSKLQVEACPAGSRWDDPACTQSSSPVWTSVTAADLPEGVAVQTTVDLLATGVKYHWRARVLYSPEASGDAGFIVGDNPAHGPWRRLHAQSFTNDIITLPAEAMPHSPGSGGGGGGGGGCFIQTVAQ